MDNEISTAIIRIRDISSGIANSLESYGQYTPSVDTIYKSLDLLRDTIESRDKYILELEEDFETELKMKSVYISEITKLREAVDEEMGHVDRLLDERNIAEGKLRIAEDALVESRKFMNRLPSMWFSEWLVAKQDIALSKITE